MAEKGKLTKRQREVYNFIQSKIRHRGYGPTVREIGAEFDIKSPNGVMCHLQALVRKGLITREANMSRAISVVGRDRRKSGIPLEGVIAAGSPVEAYEDVERLDLDEMFHKEGLVALKVRGQSMIEDHIDDGDFVIIRKQNTANRGQIVVALVDGAETTLKRYFPEKKHVRLEPANREMEPILSNDVQILGVMVGVVRKIEGVG